MAFPVLGAIGAGLGFGSLLSGLFSTSSTNSSNLRIARMNNNFNERMMNQQNDWNYKMWLRENAYNSASEQKRRFEEAGLNPYLAMTQGAEAGMASSASAAPPATASDVGRQQPFDPSSHIGSLVNSLLEARQLDLQDKKYNAEIEKLRKESEQIGVNTRWLNATHDARVREMIEKSDLPAYEKRLMRAQVKSLRSSTDWQERQNELFDITYNDHVNELSVRNQLAASQAAKNWIDAQIQHHRLPYIVPQMRAEIQRVGAECVYLAAQANLSDKQANNLIADTLIRSFGGRINKITPQQWHDIAEAFVVQSKNAGTQSTMNVLFTPLREFTGAYRDFNVGRGSAKGVTHNSFTFFR